MHLYTTLLGVCVIVLSACGGGASTSTPSPTAGSSPIINSNGGGNTANIAVDENMTTTVTTVVASDADGDAIVYSMSGADAALFSLSAGALTFNAAPDYENKTTYVLTVTASDGSNSDSQDLTISINNMNDNAPVITSDTVIIFDENLSSVLTVTATDADASSLNFQVSGGLDSTLFAIDSSTGVLTFINPATYSVSQDSNGDNIYLVTVTVSDGVNSVLSDISVAIIDPALEMWVLWDKRFGGGATDSCSAIVAANNGGYILVGNSWMEHDGSIASDKSEAGWGQSDCWVIKIDSSGTKVWDKLYGGSGSDGGHDIVANSDGTFVIVGRSDSGISGNKTTENVGAGDGWIIKIDATGDKMWEKNIGTVNNEILVAIVVASGEDGGYVVAGNSIPEGSMLGDYWVMKLDGDGNIIWENTFGGTGLEILTSLVANNEGGYALAGSSSSGANGDKTELSRGGSDYWIVKIDDKGDKIWDKRFGGSAFDACKTMISNTDGSYLVAGVAAATFTHIADGDRSENSRGGDDFWVLKIDSKGDKIWDKRFGGVDDDVCFEIAADGASDYILLGQSDSAVGGDKSQSIQGMNDMWAIKIDKSGSKIWDRRFGGTANDSSYGIIVNSGGSYVVAGESSSGVGGDKTEDSRGGNDFWVVAFEEVITITSHN